MKPRIYVAFIYDPPINPPNGLPDKAGVCIGAFQSVDGADIAIDRALAAKGHRLFRSSTHEWSDSTDIDGVPTSFLVVGQSFLARVEMIELERRDTQRRKSP